MSAPAPKTSRIHSRSKLAYFRARVDEFVLAEVQRELAARRIDEYPPERARQDYEDYLDWCEESERAVAYDDFAAFAEAI